MAFQEKMAGINVFLYFFALVAVIGILVVLSMMYKNKMCTLDAPNTYCSDMNSERNQKLGRAALLRRMRGRRTSSNGGRFREGLDGNGDGGELCTEDSDCKSGYCVNFNKETRVCTNGYEYDKCTEDSQCKSGICYGAESGGGVCAPMTEDL